MKISMESSSKISFTLYSGYGYDFELGHDLDFIYNIHLNSLYLKN